MEFTSTELKESEGRNKELDEAMKIEIEREAHEDRVRNVTKKFHSNAS